MRFLRPAFICALSLFGFASAHSEPSKCLDRAEIIERAIGLKSSGLATEILAFDEQKTHFADVLGEVNSEKNHTASETIIITLQNGFYLAAIGFEGRFCIVEGITRAEDLAMGVIFRKRALIAKSQKDI